MSVLNFCRLKRRKLSCISRSRDFARCFNSRRWGGSLTRRKIVSIIFITILLCIVCGWTWNFIKFTNWKLSPEEQERFDLELLYQSRKFGKGSKLNASTKLLKTVRPGECERPGLDPFDPDAMKYMRAPNEYDCTKDYPLLFYTDLDSNLIINGTISGNGFLDCCYKEILRPQITRRDVFLQRALGSIMNGYNVDDKYSFSEKCEPIKDNVTKMSKAIDFIAVFCRKESSSTFKMMDAFAFVPLKQKVEKRIRLSSRIFTDAVNNPDDSTFVNIVTLVIDSVSHMHFVRTMPKTRNYIIKNLSAISMDGYNIIGENSLPNAIPIVSGKTEEECHKKDILEDNCEFIWKYLAELGYRTIYFVECATDEEFNLKPNGFKGMATDYDFRPMFLTVRNLPPNVLNYRNCYGPRLGFEIVLDNIKKAAYTFRNKKKYFQLVWSSSLSHDNLHNIKIGDDLLLETITWLKDGNFLNNTVLILMSDHGIRMNEFAFTPLGRTEHKNPFIYFIFPEWFLQTYTEAVDNLKINSKRLTTHFDLHETFKDLAALENIENSRIIQRSGELNSYSTIPRGISLFLQVPITRNCQQAGVPGLYCICFKMESVAIVTEEMVSAAKAIVESVNGKISPYPQCTSWTFEKISRVEKFISTGSEKELTSAGMTYIINVITMPAEASFQSIVFAYKGWRRWSVSKEITRTSMYGNQSYCVYERIAKPFCYCASLLSHR